MLLVSDCGGPCTLSLPGMVAPAGSKRFTYAEACHSSSPSLDGRALSGIGAEIAAPERVTV